MKYQQLTEGKRYQISALLEQRMSVASTALSIGYHKGSIYRELRRNGGKENYCGP